MNQPLCTRPTEEIEAALARLDLEPIIFKLTHSGEEHEWTRERAERIAVCYRRFLFLTVTAGEPIVPTLHIDDFWHAHILDTRKYMVDCDATFGFYLHHFPYFGLRGDQDAANLRHAAERTGILYQERYGEPYFPQGTDVRAAGCSDCKQCSACVGASCVEVQKAA